MESTKLTTLLAPLKLLGDEVSMPAQEGVGRDSRCYIGQAFPPERTDEHRAATAVRVGETQPAAVELGFEPAIFFDQIGDHQLPVTLEPAGQHGNQQGQDHDRSSGSSRCTTSSLAYLSTAMPLAGRCNRGYLHF
jgi:hypothetical protein